MKITKRNVLELFTVLIGGVIFVGIIWFLYVGIYNALETILYPNDPLSFPADLLRFGAATLFLVLFLLFFKRIQNLLLRATISVAPISTFFIMIVLNLYTQYYLWIPIILVLTALLVLELIKLKLPWYFYVSLGYSVLLSLLYAWPR